MIYNIEEQGETFQKKTNCCPKYGTINEVLQK
jgi:hypothetical protein